MREVDLCVARQALGARNVCHRRLYRLSDLYYPPGVFAASVTCHGTCANCQAREKDTSVCALARHTCDDDECQERVAAVAPSTLVSLVPSNPSAT